MANSRRNSNGNGNGRYAPGLASGTYYAAALIITIIGGFWVVMQTEIANLKETDVQTRQVILTVTNERKQDIKDLEARLERDVTNLNKQIDIINAELIERRKEFLTTRDAELVAKATDDQVNQLRDRLKTIETTRPTAGELQSVSDSLRTRIEKLYSAIDSINNWIRQHPADEQQRYEPKNPGPK